MAKSETKASWLNTIKWIAICVTTVTVAVMAYKAWQIATSPVRAAQSVAQGVGSAAEGVVSEAEDIAHGRRIDLSRQGQFDRVSEAAFDTLAAMPVSPPENVGAKLFRAANLRASGDKVCEMEVDFGAGPIRVYAAANNEDHATARDLGVKDDRTIRIYIVTENDPVGLRAYWDNETQSWKMRWRRAMLKKPISDKVANARLIDVLKAIPKNCTPKPAAVPED